MASLSLIEIALLVSGTLATAALAGVLAGMLGVGGGIVIVPALFWILTFVGFGPEIAMPTAVGTSLCTIIVTSLSSTRAHKKRGAVDEELMSRWWPWLAFGAAAGGTVAGIIDASWLMIVFGFTALLIAFNLAMPRIRVIAETLPASRMVQSAIATGIGWISAMMGIGGGTLGVPVLTAFSLPVHRAVGTSSAFGFVIAVPSVLALAVTGLGVAGRPPLSIGYVNLVAAAMIVPISASLAPYGAHLAHKMNALWVRRAFALFLAITALRMLWTVFATGLQ